MVSGQPYERYVERQIIRRLGLTHTSPTLTPVVRRRLAQGYGRDMPPGPRATFRQVETNALAAATGFSSTVRDLCAFMSAHFLGSRALLSDTSKREMQRVHWLNRTAEHHYGIGTEIWKVDGNVIVGHGGGFPGFITKIGWDPERKIGVAVLTNALDGLAGILVNGVFSTIYEVLRRGAEWRTPRKAPLNLARYEGRFCSRWSDTEIVRVGHRLVAFAPQGEKPLAESAVLEPLGRHRFRISSGSEFGYLGEPVTFRFDGRGRLRGLSWGQLPLRASFPPESSASSRGAPMPRRAPERGRGRR